MTSYGNFGRRKDHRQRPTRTTANQGGEIVVGLCAKIHRSAESADLHNRVESAVECSKGMPREMKLDRTTKMAKAGQRRKKTAAEKLGIRAIGLKLHEQPYDYEKALADVPTEADGLLIPMDSHWCPVKTTIESTGYLFGPRRIAFRRSKTLGKWAFSRIGTPTESVAKCKARHRA